VPQEKGETSPGGVHAQKNHFHQAGGTFERNALSWDKLLKPKGLGESETQRKNWKEGANSWSERTAYEQGTASLKKGVVSHIAHQKSIYVSESDATWKRKVTVEEKTNDPGHDKVLWWPDGGKDQVLTTGK